MDYLGGGDAMSTDPIARRPATFGALLHKLRVGRGIDTAEFARAARLTSTEKLARLENGDAEPTLTEFFRIAGALNEPPAVLLVDLIANWREDSNFEYVYRAPPWGLRPPVPARVLRTVRPVSRAGEAARLNRCRHGGVEDAQCHALQAAATSPRSHHYLRPTGIRAVQARKGDEPRHTCSRRAEARGVRTSRYLAALVRAHIAASPPLTVDEVAILKEGVAVLAKLSRALTHTAHSVSQSGLLTPELQKELSLTRAVVAAIEQRTHDLTRSALITWESRYE